MASDGIGGINKESLSEILEANEETKTAIRDTITSKTGLDAYDYATNVMAGHESLT